MTDKYAKPFNSLDRYAVVGNPIAHSKSPLIHEAFAKQTNQDISYEPILAPLDGFEATVRDLIASGYKGANVTVPFKFEAFQLSTSLAPQVDLAGAVNTMIFSDIGIIGHNTDGDGLVRDITQNLATNIEGKRVLLLGAGGAAEGVFQLLLVKKPAKLVVANRTYKKALRLVEKSFDKARRAEACTFDDLNDQQFDIIINATSTGLTDTALPIPNTIFAKGCLAYDMMYGRETPFMKQARENGAQVADGLGMLVEQAAEAFYIWRGVRPETQSVIQLIRNLA
ncbi:MAG: shikimate dehydrogenase [Methylotenera sp.]|uniref:shikimate dehydrogenase n=1 Tax=Methylotenera sp. TaxID=2051956 RepID=UPI0024887FE6|nr:shikimate dehydrogenase [Methylotenera sp.]MDI1308705.1 shikimate dehydrogenase [Methylotenera sp.]